HVPCNPPGGNPYLFGNGCDPNATAASFQEMQNVSGYAMIIGLIILPAGLFKDGLPSPGSGAKIFIGMILILLLAGVFTAALVATPTSSSKGGTLTPDGYLSILSGSGSNPSVLVTFFPQNVTLIIGHNNTVEWTNNDTTTHTITSVTIPSGAASFNDFISPGGKYTYDFTMPGTYYYVCTLHAWMKGWITVKS
ncbi:MAG: cupredoxin domain-containing protein, partial [Nitrososphaerales archaeon]